MFKRLLNENGDLTVKGIVCVVLIALVSAAVLDAVANVSHKLIAGERGVEGGIYNYYPEYMARETYGPQTKDSVTANAYMASSFNLSDWHD